MQNKFPHFINTVFALRIYAGIVKVRMPHSLIQNHPDRYARFMQFYAIAECLDFQEIMLPNRKECRRIIPASLV